MDEFAVLAHQAGIGALAVYLMQILKNSKRFPWINANSSTLNRWLSIGVAVLTSLGIKYAASGGPDTGYHIVLSIPALGQLTDAAIHAAAQYAGQQILYYTSVKEPGASGQGPQAQVPPVV